MEIHIVFAHKLIEMNVFGIEPPFLPFWCIIGSDTGVSDGCVVL